MMPMTEVGIDEGIMRDVYVALGEPIDGGWAVRLYVKPLVRWLWIGALIMAVGACICLIDKRYRVQNRKGRV